MHKYDPQWPLTDSRAPRHYASVASLVNEWLIADQCNPRLVVIARSNWYAFDRVTWPSMKITRHYRVLLSGLTIPRRGMLDRCFREFCKNFRSIRRSSLRTKPNICATVICFPLNIILKSIKSKRPWNFLTSTWNRRYLTEYVTLDGHPHKGMKIYSRTRRFRYSAYAMYNFNEEIISCLFMEIFFIYF